MSKNCIDCKENKLLSDFPKRKTAKDGYRNQCKICFNKKLKKYKEKNKMKIKQNQSDWYQENKSRILEERKIYQKNNKEILKIKKKEYIKKNKDKVKIRTQKYYQLNKDKIKQYRKDNIEQVRQWGREYHHRNKTNLNYLVMKRIRGRLGQYLKTNNIRKHNTTIQSIGLDKKMFSKWIEFNLNLDKLDEYHLDHFIPLSSFKCKTYEDVINSKCNHWTNIIPLTEEDNLTKGDRMPTFKEKVKMDLRIVCFKLSNLL